MSEVQSHLDAALTYADLGYKVFPCAPGAKTPLTAHGLRDATDDLDRIEKWWKKTPDANIAIATEGMLVVDVDGPDNPWLRDEPEKQLDLARAPQSLTANGGRQYLFRQSHGRNWRNTAGKIAPQVDTRGDGGYIVVPPSVLTGDKRYRWQPMFELTVPPAQLPEPPAWLAVILDDTATGNGTRAVATSDANAIPEGQRNATLVSLGGTMRRVGMAHNEIMAALREVNANRCHPPLAMPEVDRIGASVVRYEPDQVATAMVEGHWQQMVDGQGQSERIEPPSVREIVRLYPTLRAPVIHGLLRRGETMNVISAPKIGKALAVDTPILTETGWLRMGELRPGMKVHTADGTLTAIVAVSEIMHGRPCYRVTTRSGAAVVADKDHLWTVSQRETSAVVTTEELAAGRGRRRWLLPITAALERDEIDLPLDPWVLGYWLGNGTAREGAVTANEVDLNEVSREINRAGFRIGRVKSKPGAATFTVLKLNTVLREMDLLYHKHIPEAYLRASQRQRAALLAGLLDADGHAATQANGSARVEFTITDQDLFFQALKLIRSLGFKASTSVARAKLNGIDCGHKLRIWFAIGRQNSPFRLSRRTNALPPGPVHQRSRRDAVVSVEPVPSVPVRCIQVAHPSGLFLAGHDFIVTHNSWLVIDLGLSVATGRQWLGTYHCERGNVLILDNELHGETSAHRIPKVANARGIPLDAYGDRMFVQNMRGQLRDVFSLGAFFAQLEPGRFSIIVLDAFYRFMPRDMDENDNGTMASLYNHLDLYADRLQCCFVLIHHTTKGSQSLKSVTDVGAGAGSQSRATDTHLVLRPHEEDDAVVLDAAVRSWPPVQAQCLRWAFPVWEHAEDLDPLHLRSESGKKRGEKKDEWSPDMFVDAFITDQPETRSAIIGKAVRAGLSKWAADNLLRMADGDGLMHREGTGSRTAPFIYQRLSTSSGQEDRS